MESLGATSNAGTDRESTIYWIHVAQAVAVKAARLIGAVALAPLLHPEHMRIERQIVIEEIRSYDDDPSEQAGTALISQPGSSSSHAFMAASSASP